MGENQSPPNTSNGSEKKPGPYFDEEQNELTRHDWIADRLFATYLAMNRPDPGPGPLGIMAEDLAAELTDQQLLSALARLRKESEWVSVKAIIQLAARDDGRPEVEAAWALCPLSEEKSVVWTAEMAEAYGMCRPILAAGDAIAARMVFKEQYPLLVDRARSQRRPVQWSVSFGWDQDDRVRALQEAVEHKQLKVSTAVALMPERQHEFQEPTDAALVLAAPKAETRSLLGIHRVLHTMAEEKLIDRPPQQPPPAESVFDNPAKLQTRREELKRQIEAARREASA